MPPAVINLIQFRCVIAEKLLVCRFGKTLMTVQASNSKTRIGIMQYHSFVTHSTFKTNSLVRSTNRQVKNSYFVLAFDFDITTWQIYCVSCCHACVMQQIAGLFAYIHSHVTATRCICNDDRLQCWLQTPDMYADVPPAPPGLIWWEYRAGVPALPQPATYFGLANWTNWGWRYDPSYAVPFYQYSNIDQVLCATH